MIMSSVIVRDTLPTFPFLQTFHCFIELPRDSRTGLNRRSNSGNSVWFQIRSFRHPASGDICSKITGGFLFPYEGLFVLVQFQEEFYHECICSQLKPKPVTFVKEPRF